MGMIASLTAVDATTLTRIRSNPDLLFELLDPVAIEDEQPDAPDVFSIDLDKAWHAIHYILTDSVWEGSFPKAFLLKGGTMFGGDPDDPLSDQPSRAFSAEQTRAIADMLKSVPLAVFASKYDPRLLDAAKIYPEGIWLRDGDDAREYVTSYYDTLTTFVNSAASKGYCLLVSIG
ncbi:MAG: YfbM family protein [Phycisphaerales bacterium]